MKIEPIAVYAVNATVVTDITPTGKPKYIIQLNYDAGIAIDRIQSCGDYKMFEDSSNLENNVFVNGNTFIAFSFNPRNDNSVSLLTCMCQQGSLEKEESLKQIELGMQKALKKLNELYKKHS